METAKTADGRFAASDRALCRDVQGVRLQVGFEAHPNGMFFPSYRVNGNMVPREDFDTICRMLALGCSATPAP